MFFTRHEPAVVRGHRLLGLLLTAFFFLLFFISLFSYYPVLDASCYTRFKGVPNPRQILA